MERGARYVRGIQQDVEIVNKACVCYHETVGRLAHSIPAPLRSSITTPNRFISGLTDTGTQQAAVFALSDTILKLFNDLERFSQNLTAKYGGIKQGNERYYQSAATAATEAAEKDLPAPRTRPSRCKTCES
jgi:hypothetical protein